MGIEFIVQGNGGENMNQKANTSRKKIKKQPLTNILYQQDMLSLVTDTTNNSIS